MSAEQIQEEQSRKTESKLPGLELEASFRQAIEKATAEGDTRLMSGVVNKLAEEYRDSRFGLRRTRKIMKTLATTGRLLRDYREFRNRAFEMKFFQMLIRIIKREFYFLDKLAFHLDYHGKIISMTEQLWQDNSSEFGVLDDDEELFACIAKSFRKGFDLIAGPKYFKGGFDELTQYMYDVFQNHDFKERVQRQPGFLISAHMPYSSPSTPEEAAISFRYILEGFDNGILNKEQYRDLVKRLILEFSKNTDGLKILTPFNMLNLRFSKTSPMLKEIHQIEVEMNGTKYSSAEDKKGSKIKHPLFGGSPIEVILQLFYTEFRHCKPTRMKQGKTMLGKKRYIDIFANGTDPTSGERYECKLRFTLVR